MTTAIEQVFSGATKTEKAPETNSGSTADLAKETGVTTEKTEVAASPSTGSVDTTKAALEPKAATVVTEKSPKESGLMGALIGERRKRQSLEKEIETLRNGGQVPAYPVDTYVEPAVASKRDIESVTALTDARLTAMSEQMARSAHPDFQEKYDAFAAVAAENPEFLRQVIMESDNPGESVYVAGKTILFQKEYGIDPDEVLSNVEKKLRPKLKSEIEAEVLEKLKGKQSLPTNILNQRAASGGSAPEFRPSGWSNALGKKKR